METRKIEITKSPSHTGHGVRYDLFINNRAIAYAWGDKHYMRTLLGNRRARWNTHLVLHHPREEHEYLMRPESPKAILERLVYRS